MANKPSTRSNVFQKGLQILSPLRFGKEKKKCKVYDSDTSVTTDSTTDSVLNVSNNQTVFFEQLPPHKTDLFEEKYILKAQGRDQNLTFDSDSDIDDPFDIVNKSRILENKMIDNNVHVANNDAMNLLHEKDFTGDDTCRPKQPKTTKDRDFFADAGADKQLNYDTDFFEKNERRGSYLDLLQSTQKTCHTVNAPVSTQPSSDGNMGKKSTTSNDNPTGVNAPGSVPWVPEPQSQVVYSSGTGRGELGANTTSSVYVENIHDRHNFNRVDFDMSRLPGGLANVSSGADTNMFQTQERTLFATVNSSLSQDPRLSAPRIAGAQPQGPRFLNPTYFPRHSTPVDNVNSHMFSNNHVPFGHGETYAPRVQEPRVRYRPGGVASHLGPGHDGAHIFSVHTSQYTQTDQIQTTSQNNGGFDQPHLGDIEHQNLGYTNRESQQMHSQHPELSVTVPLDGANRQHLDRGETLSTRSQNPRSRYLGDIEYQNLGYNSRESQQMHSQHPECLVTSPLDGANYQHLDNSETLATRSQNPRGRYNDKSATSHFRPGHTGAQSYGMSANQQTQTDRIPYVIQKNVGLDPLYLEETGYQNLGYGNNELQPMHTQQFQLSHTSQCTNNTSRSEISAITKVSNISPNNRGVHFSQAPTAALLKATGTDTLPASSHMVITTNDSANVSPMGNSITTSSSTSHNSSATDELLHNLVDSLHTLTDRNNNTVQQGGSRWIQQQAPIFTGKYEENFMKWKRRAEIYFSFLQLRDDKKLASLPMLLEDRAFTYFHEIPAEKRKTFSDAMKALEAKFGPDSKSVLFHTSILNYNQGAQSVADYSTKLIDKLAMLNIEDESQKLNIYLRGLRPEIASSVILMKPNNLNEAESSAMLAEATANFQKGQPIDELKAAVNSLTQVLKDHAAEGAQAQVNSVEQRPSSPSPNIVTQPNANSQHQSGPGTHWRPRPVFQPRTGYQGYRGQRPYFNNQQNQGYPPSQQQYTETRRCHYCNEVGHLVRSCPYRETERSRRLGQDASQTNPFNNNQQ